MRQDIAHHWADFRFENGFLGSEKSLKRLEVFLETGMERGTHARNVRRKKAWRKRRMVRPAV